MNPFLTELYAHQEWADAEHWRAFESYPAALADKAIRERLLHIHMVQQAFSWAANSQRGEFAFKTLDDFPDISDLKKYAQRGLQGIREVLQATDEVRMEQLIDLPWFTPPFKVSVRQALTQAAMHSHHHRGQNATRLRELGGVPPNDRFHHLAAQRTTWCKVELKGGADYSETLCSSFWERRTRSTE